MSFYGRMRWCFSCLIVFACGCTRPSALQSNTKSESPASADVREVREQKIGIDGLPEDFEARISSRWAESMESARSHFLQGDINRTLIELETAEAIKINSATRELRTQVTFDQTQRDAIRRGTCALEDGYYDEAIRFFEQANSFVPTQESENLLRRARCRAYVQSAMTQLVRGDRSRAIELLGEALWHHECGDARQLLNEISHQAASMPGQ